MGRRCKIKSTAERRKFYTEPKEYPSVPPLYTDPGGTTVLVYTTGSFSFLMLRF
jgi:hypothetical protein